MAVLLTMAVALSPDVALADEQCAAFAEIPQGKYWINNNLWGQSGPDGRQCIEALPADPGTISWRTTWDWSGEPHQVKSFASAVLGWHWGWKRPGTGLPIRLSDRTPVRTSWDYSVSHAQPGAMNVAYDLWAHDVAQPDWGDDPTDEIMVWLYRSGGAGPLGQRVDTVTIDGTRWDLYKGRTSWNVYSFVRTTNTESVDLDLTDFTDELVRRGDMSPSKYLSSVQAGPEIFTGRGSVTTESYRVDIGGSPDTPTTTTTTVTTPSTTTTVTPAPTTTVTTEAPAPPRPPAARRNLLDLFRSLRGWFAGR